MRFIRVRKILKFSVVASLLAIIAIFDNTSFYQQPALASSGGNAIAYNARKLAWPEDQASQAKDNPTSDYATLAGDKKDSKSGIDFVKIAVSASGADPTYPNGDQTYSELAKYMNESSKWMKLESPTEADLEPGDVFITTGSHKHAFIYLGDGKVASASSPGNHFGRVGNLSEEWCQEDGGSTPFKCVNETFQVYRLGEDDYELDLSSLSNSIYTGASDDFNLSQAAQNSIDIWQPCGYNNGLSGPCGGEITGETWQERLQEVVEKYGIMLMNMQIEYGIPWEIPIIHAHAESHFGLANPSVAHTTEECGYFNWMGYKYGASSLYGISSDEMGDCRAWHSDGGFGSMYENLADMFMSFAADYLRNGAYDSAFQYASPGNFDPRAFLYAETDGIYCTAGCGSYYLSVYDQDIDMIHEIAASMGYPTSTELQKQEKIDTGGNWPVNGDIKDQIGAEPHSLHADCSDSSTSSMGSGGGASNGKYEGDGSDVTFIGDSITAIYESAFKQEGKLPNADIYAQSSKSFGRDENGNESGLTILRRLASEGKLRKTLVFALGSNDGDGTGGVTDKQLEELVSLASNCDKIILLTNYFKGSASEYSINNDRFKRLAEEEDKVILADWKTEASKDPDKYLAGNVHPTSEGADLFINLIIEALGRSVSTSSSKDDECECEKGGAVSLEGGLTYEEAQKIADYYNDNDISGIPPQQDGCASAKENCVALSAWFVNALTDIVSEGTNPTRGNGLDVAGNLAADYNLETSDTPVIFSVFSNPSGTAVNGSNNHTGVVVGIEGDEVITIEAACGGWSGQPDGLARVWKYTMPESGILYADISGHLDTDAISKIIGREVSTNYNQSTGGVAVSDVTWADGWITGGLDGYVKESATDSNYQLGDSAHNGQYTTNSPKGGGSGANKITLHSTEGGSGDGNSGLALYGNDGSGIYPAHFTIDLKAKKVYQHFPITQPADSVKSHDASAGVQIEIIGFSDLGRSGSDLYLLDGNNFGEDDWAYLAKLLAAISSETGIPLSTNVDWENPSRLSSNDFKAYEGILGHMHVPDNDHTDPGNIWPMVSKSFQNVNNSECDQGWTGDFPWYNQCDERWGNSEFGPPCGGVFSSICDGGCGVASFAMMATALTGKVILPDEVGKYAGDLGQHVCGAGSSHSLPATIADHFGLQHEDMGSPSIEEINAKLKDGWMIWTCGNGGEPFTSGGHCIGIRGITSGGKWLVADSKGNGEENTLHTEWDPSTVYSNMNTFQAIKRK